VFNDRCGQDFSVTIDIGATFADGGDSILRAAEGHRYLDTRSGGEEIYAQGEVTLAQVLGMQVEFTTVQICVDVAETDACHARQ